MDALGEETSIFCRQCFLRRRPNSGSLAREGGSFVSGPGQLTAVGKFLYIDSADAAQRQDVYAGNLIFGYEHLSDAFSVFLNGVDETGLLTANVPLRRILELERQSREAVE